jgi:hypothetical protein
MNASKDSSSREPLSLGWIRDSISGLAVVNDFRTVMDIYNLMRNHTVSLARIKVTTSHSNIMLLWRYSYHAADS